MGNQFGLEDLTSGAFFDGGNERFLRLGERRWVPQSQVVGRLLVGADFRGSWGAAEISCVLVGVGGAAVGVIGLHSLHHLDGVSLDFIGGTEVFSICLARLNASVRSLYLVALPNDEVDDARGHAQPAISSSAKSALPQNSAGPVTAYVARAPGGPVGGGQNLGLQPPRTALCRLRASVPSRMEESGVVLLAFHQSGADANAAWHVQGIGRTQPLAPLPEAVIGQARPRHNLLLAFEPLLRELAGKAHGERPEGSLPDPDSRGPWVGFSDMQALATPPAMPTQEEELASANRLAGEKAQEAERERRRSAALQRMLAQTQESLRRVCAAVSSMQYGLEAWRREALLKAHTGDGLQVAQMLDKLPHSLRLEDLVAPKADEEEPAPAPMPGLGHGLPTPRMTATENWSPRGNPQLPPGADRTLNLLPGDAGVAMAAVRGNGLVPGEGVGSNGGLSPQARGSPGEEAPGAQPPAQAWPQSPRQRAEYRDRDPKHKMLKPRAGDPMTSRPGVTVGDQPLALIDDEELARTGQQRRPFLGTASTRGTATSANADGDRRDAYTGPPIPPPPPLTGVS